MIVEHIVMMVVETVRDSHDLPFKINRFHFPREEIDSLQQFSDGIDDICEIKITGCDLVQHRREQKEVVAVHKRDLHLGIACQCVIEVNRRMEPGETAAKNQNPSFL